MGQVTDALYGRSTLPKIAIIYAGGYFERRSNEFLKIFDSYEPIKGGWTPYSYAKSGNEEFFIIFNIYGAAMTLEVLHLLVEGNVDTVIFIGSMFSKDLDVGYQVLVKSVVDRAGVVQIDTRGVDLVEQSENQLKQQRNVYSSNKIEFQETVIASVPCVLHNITHLLDYIRTNEMIRGIEMELSTFYHFTKKLSMNSFAFLYVSDNPEHSLLNQELSLQNQRIEAAAVCGKLAIELSKSI